MNQKTNSGNDQEEIKTKAGRSGKQKESLSVPTVIKSK